MKKLKELLGNSVGSTQIIYVTGGNLVSTSLSAIALILISRILGPEDFGLFSVGFSISLILVRINDFGLNSAIIKYATSARTDKKSEIFSLTLKYKLLVSTTIILIGLVASRSLIKILNFQSPAIYFLSFSLGLSTVYYEQFLNILQSLHHFKKVVLMNVVQASTKLLGVLLLIFTNFKHSSIFFTLYVSAPLIPVLLVRHFLPNWCKIELSISGKLKPAIVNMAKHSSIALISAGVIENIDVLFLQSHLSSFETGLYAGISKIALMFSIFAYSLGSVLYARVAKYKHKSDLRMYLKKVVALIAFSTACLTLLVILSPTLIQYTIGSEYLVGENTLILLLIAAYFTIISVPFIAMFYTFKTNWYFSIGGVLQLCIILVGNAMFVPILGIQASALTRLVAKALIFFFTMASALFIYRKSFKYTHTL